MKNFDFIIKIILAILLICGFIFACNSEFDDLVASGKIELIESDVPEIK